MHINIFECENRLDIFVVEYSQVLCCIFYSTICISSVRRDEPSRHGAAPSLLVCLYNDDPEVRLTFFAVVGLRCAHRLVASLLVVGCFISFHCIQKRDNTRRRGPPPLTSQSQLSHPSTFELCRQKPVDMALVLECMTLGKTLIEHKTL